MSLPLWGTWVPTVLTTTTPFYLKTKNSIISSQGLKFRYDHSIIIKYKLTPLLLTFSSHTHTHILLSFHSHLFRRDDLTWEDPDTHSVMSCGLVQIFTLHRHLHWVHSAITSLSLTGRANMTFSQSCDSMIRHVIKCAILLPAARWCCFTIQSFYNVFIHLQSI